MITLEQLNDHRRTFPAFSPDTVAARAAAVEADILALEALAHDYSTEIAASVTRANAVDAYLESLKANDSELFETVRRETFEQQAARAGL